MEKINVNAKKHIFDLAMDVSGVNSYLENKINEILGKYILMECDEFHVYNADILKEDKYIVSESLKRMYSRVSKTDLFIERKHINEFYVNAIKSGSYSCFFPRKVYVTKSCNIIVFSKKIDFFQDFVLHVHSSQKFYIQNIGQFEVEFRENRDCKKFEIRSFLPGDRYRGKKLKEYFLEKKVPNFFRKAVPLIAIGSNIIHNFLFDGEEKELIEEDCRVSFIFHPSELYCKIKHFLI
jgi:hypothetical protein